MQQLLVKPSCNREDRRCHPTSLRMSYAPTAKTSAARLVGKPENQSSSIVSQKMTRNPGVILCIIDTTLMQQYRLVEHTVSKSSN